MWLAAAIAIPLRVNLPLAVATVWLTNPFTMPPIFYGAYLIGVKVLGAPEQKFSFQLSWQWVIDSVETIGPAFLVGCGICSVFFGLLGYFSLNYIWRWSVIKAWRVRELKRQKAKENRPQK
jgi:uncharacterized protein